MEIKTTKEIWDDWGKVNHKSKLIRKKHIDKQWVAVDDLIKCIDNTYKDLDMGKTIPIFIQRLKEKLTN